MDTNQKRARVVYALAITSAAFTTAITIILVVAQAYVRWALNQNFTFLGGNELETLTVATSLLIAALAYTYRTRE